MLQLYYKQSNKKIRTINQSIYKFSCTCTNKSVRYSRYVEQNHLYQFVSIRGQKDTCKSVRYVEIFLINTKCHLHPQRREIGVPPSFT